MFARISQETCFAIANMRICLPVQSIQFPHVCFLLAMPKRAMAVVQAQRQSGGCISSRVSIWQMQALVSNVRIDHRVQKAKIFQRRCRWGACDPRVEALAQESWWGGGQRRAQKNDDWCGFGRWQFDCFPTKVQLPGSVCGRCDCTEVPQIFKEKAIARVSAPTLQLLTCSDCNFWLVLTFVVFVQKRSKSAVFIICCFLHLLPIVFFVILCVSHKCVEIHEFSQILAEEGSSRVRARFEQGSRRPILRCFYAFCNCCVVWSVSHFSTWIMMFSNSFDTFIGIHFFSHICRNSWIVHNFRVICLF